MGDVQSKKPTDDQNAAWFRAAREEIANLSAFDGADLLAQIAALHLDPTNAKHLLRLEAISHFVTAEHAGGSALIGRDRLNRLVNGGIIAAGVARLEDPPETLFTSCASFFGGSYLFLSGRHGGIEFALVQLAKALALHNDPFEDSAFRAWAVRLIAAVLRVSDAMLRRAGLSRYVSPEGVSTAVTIPDAERLRRRQQTVMFTGDEISALLQPMGGGVVLEPMVARMGAVSLGSFHPDREALSGRPLVDCGDTLVVANPSGLVPAVVMAVLEEAERRGLSESLAERFTDAVWERVQDPMRLLCQGRERMKLKPWGHAPVPCREAVYSIDSDKALYVMLLGDPLAMAADMERTRKGVDLRAAGEAIEARLEMVSESLAKTYKLLQEVHVLFLVQSCGGPVLFAMDGPPGMGERLLAMTADELCVLAHVSQGNSLMLRQFARARERFRQRAEVQAWSILDEFAFYRGRQYSFLGNEVMNYAMITSDFQLELRLEVARRRDWHGVRSPTKGTVDVVRRWEDGEVPVYFAPSMMDDRLNFMVESAAPAVWALEREDESIEPALLEMIAFWLWQVSGDMDEFFGTLAGEDGVVVLEFHAPAIESWQEPPESFLAMDQCVIVNKGAAGWFEVELRSEISHHFRVFDNSGERAFVKALLAGLRERVKGDEACPTDQELGECIERHAPLGPKKMFHMLPADLFAGLRSSPFGAVRFVQAAEESQVLDELAEFLKGEGYKEGAISREGREREETLKKCVAQLYGQFADCVASLSPDGLLEVLLGANDALVADGRWREVTLPHRATCFSDAPTLSQEFAQEGSDNAKAGVALRWLIEYVAAQPPTGGRRVSMAAYDRTIALVAAINWLGMESDYIHHGIVDSGVLIHPSGRLTVEGNLGDARRAFVSRRAMGAIRRHQAGWVQWASLSEEDREREESEVNKELDRVTTIEFGISLSTVTAAIDCLVDEFKPKHGSVVIETQTDVVSRLAAGLSCSEQEALKVIDHLALTEREEFLKPPAPYADDKPYPWRLGRALLFVSRPIVQRGSGETAELLWGVTQLCRAANYIRHQVLSGRLKARTEEMREFIGRVHERQGKEFESQVLQEVQQDKDLVVRGRVRKIGKHKLIDAKGRNLGDIDVLAAWPKRKLLFALECKDLSVGRTPSEVSNELNALFRDKGSRDSAKTKHVRRAAWLAAHLSETLTWFGLRPAGRWRVVPVIVTSVELMGTEFESGIPVVTLTELEHDGLTELAARLQWHQHRVKAEDDKPQD